MICPACNWDLDATVLWSAELILPLEWPSQNVLGANRKGYAGYTYRKYKARFEGCLRKYSKTVPRATGWRRAYLIRRYGARCRPFDHGNLVGGAKPLIDALVNLGYLKNDDQKHFLGSYHQEKAADGKNALAIRLEETDPSRA